MQGLLPPCGVAGMGLRVRVRVNPNLSFGRVWLFEDL